MQAGNAKLARPTCLHIPPLYEESTAKIMWESVDGAERYELDSHFNETFEDAPASGLSWRAIEFRGSTWGAINVNGVSWSMFLTLPAEFTIFSGPGEKVPGPGVGLSWADIRAMQRLWSEIQSLGKSWEDFKALIANGLMWRSLNARFLTWLEFEAHVLTWEDFQALPADSKPHIMFDNADIPLYAKSAVFRVRALNDMAKSDYLTSSLIPTRPRSLARFKPPCLHIPDLYEGNTAVVAWGKLYGASGYIVERNLNNSGLWETVFDGMGSELSREEWRSIRGDFTSWFDTLGNDASRRDFGTPTDDQPHFTFTDRLPVPASTAKYRIRGYNTTDSSLFLETDAVGITPIFHRRDSIRVNGAAGSNHFVQLHAERIGDFREVIMTLRYDPAALSLERISLETPDGRDDIAGRIPESNALVVSNMPGQVQFRCVRQMRIGSDWCGLVVSARFRGLRAGNSDISLS